MKSLIGRRILCLFPLALALVASCSWDWVFVVTGTIADYEKIKSSGVSITFDGYHESVIEPDTLSIQEDGRYRLVKHFGNSMPQALSLRSGDRIRAKLLFREKGVFEKIAGNRHFVFTDVICNAVFEDAPANDPTYPRVFEFNNVLLRPQFSDSILRILNFEDIFDKVEYRDSTVVFHFKERPPKGSTIIVYGNAGSHFQKLTLKDLDTIVPFYKHEFYYRTSEDNWGFKKVTLNILKNARIYSPYAWFIPVGLEIQGNYYLDRKDRKFGEL